MCDKPKLIYYRDYQMTADWPERIQRAQFLRCYVIEEKPLRRIRYGTRNRFHCHDCGILPGELHVPGCDMERCPRCRGQVIVCICVSDEQLQPGYMGSGN